MSDSDDSVSDTSVTDTSVTGSDDSGDSITEVSEQSWLGRLAGSFIAALIGLVLFIASFPLLYWNEGHAVAVMNSLNAGARTVISAPADPVNPANDGHLVHVSGSATFAKPAGDPLFQIAPATALRLVRHVEAYQWQEKKTTETEKNTGGSQTTKTTYSYSKGWSETPVDSSTFRQPNGHANPPMTLRTTTFDAGSVQVGAFRLDNALIDELSGFKPFVPPADATGTTGDPAFQRVGDIFYHGASSSSPAIGDMKVSYQIIEAQPVSIVGAQNGGALTPYRGSDGRTIALADLGTHSAADMFAEAKSEANVITWILRGVGFVVMLIGLTLLSSPLSWLASVLPFLEGIFDAATFFVALIIAIPLTLITIAIAWMAHRPLLGIGLLVGGLVLAYGVRKIAPNRRRIRAA